MGLSRLREQRGVDSREMGDVAGVSHDTAARWLADASEPRAGQLVAVARHYGVSVGWLLRLDESPHSAADLTTEQRIVVELAERLGYDAARRVLLDAIRPNLQHDPRVGGRVEYPGQPEQANPAQARRRSR